MLQFILGRASSGKSYEICRRIAECVKNGVHPVLIIPEQFSFESEKRILELLGDSGAQNVKVLSFTRLCDEIENICGGGASGELSDSDKIIIMKTAIKSVRDRLKYFGRYSSSSGFSKMMLNTIDEFTQNAVSVADIYEAADNEGDGVLGRKLYDTAIIFAEYNQLISERLLGFEDKLTMLYKRLNDFPYFKDKSVFIDSFSGFTGQQYRIIDRILQTAKDVTVSFCDNPYEQSGLTIFTNIKRAKNRITLYAKKHNVSLAEDYVLPAGKFVAAGISAVEEFMCLGATGKSPNSDEFAICRAKTMYDEAQFTARNIRRIVREKGAKYSDFVIIARNAADYEQVVSVALEKNGIPCFMDKRLPLGSLPPAAAARAAMEITDSLSTEKLLRFHKCGVRFLSDEELSELQNYAYIWNIDGAAWKKDWNMDPDGLEGGKMSDGELKEYLKKINALREKAISPIVDFSSEFKGGPRNMAKAVVKLLESARASFSALSDEYKTDDTVLSDAIVTSYSAVMNILDSIVNCLPAGATPREFYEAFKACIDIESVGVIPQMVDEVTFGSAERIQPSRPKYVFILGANQGVFPRTPQTSGVFAVSEIGKLIELGIEIPDCSVYSSIDEDLLLYNCVCCADRGIYISFCEVAGEPAYFVKKLVDEFGVNVKSEPDILSWENLPETAEGAFSQFCRCEKLSEDYYTLKYVLESIDDFGSRVKSVCANAQRPSFNIPRELSLKLVGSRIGLSPSRFDTYSKCAFMYFCKYALGVKSAQPVSFNALQTGTLIHYVLERFIEAAKDRIKSIKENEIFEIVERSVSEYLGFFKGYKENETPHLKLMVRDMTNTLKYLCMRLAQEFAQSDFVPEKCELKIGDDGEIPPLEIIVDDGASVTVTGSVDRLDRYGGYVRIIDYKTGTRNFKLPDILVGQNMQMLIYLYAVCGSEKFGGDPAGIFYMHAALPKENSPAEHRMSGFMPEDKALINAMDKSGKGEYIPLSSPKAKKQGTTVDDFYDIFKFIELKLKQAGRDIAAGRFNAMPIDGRDKKACEYCEFASICRIEKERIDRVPGYNASEVMDEIRRQVSENEV